MKPVDVNSNTYIDFNKENTQKGPKFEVGNHVKIFKYKNVFAKGNIPNWFEEAFAIKKIKNTVKETNEKKTNQKDISVENITKKKRDKLYVKWKVYNNSL